MNTELEFETLLILLLYHVIVYTAWSFLSETKFWNNNQNLWNSSIFITMWKKRTLIKPIDAFYSIFNLSLTAG